MPFGDLGDLSKKRVLWNTDTDFNKGTVPSELEVDGTHDAAVLRLAEKADINDDIPYTTEGNYTLSDGTKLEVDSGNAQLKSVIGSSESWPFTTGTNYTYGTAVEVTGGEAKLVDLTPTNSEYFANYSSDSDANWGSGTLTATENGNPSVSGGYLDLTDATASSVAYEGATIDADQTGCVRIVYQPNYTGFPSSNYYIWKLNPSSGAGEVYFRHDSGGNLRIVIKDNTGSTILAQTSSSWSPTAGVDYELEVNWDVASGATRIFIDGVQSGSTNTSTGTMNSGGFELYIGSYYPDSASGADSKIDGIIVYNAVQHTSNYTPAGLGSITSTKYDMTNPTIVNNTGFSFSSALNSFAESATKSGSDEIKYHVSSDNGSTWEYWTGAAWATTDDTYAQANTVTDINTNISTLAASGTFKFRALLHSDNGNTTPALSSITVEESQSYSTDDNLYLDTKDVSQIDPSDINAWLTTTITNSKPANTDIRVLFSNDGRSSWLTWGGSSWEAPTSATTRTDATSITDAQTNFSSLPIGNGTLDVRLFLYTSSNSVRPTVSNINVTGDAGYETSGVFYSNTIDSGYLDTNWGKIEYTTTTPSGTTIVVKARAENTGSPFTEVFGPAISNGEDAGVTGRLFQLEITFTGTVSERPNLDRISVDWTVPSVQQSSP